VTTELRCRSESEGGVGARLVSHENKQEAIREAFPARQYQDRRGMRKRAPASVMTFNVGIMPILTTAMLCAIGNNRGEKETKRPPPLDAAEFPKATAFGAGAADPLSNNP